MENWAATCLHEFPMRDYQFHFILIEICRQQLQQLQLVNRQNFVFEKLNPGSSRVVH